MNQWRFRVFSVSVLFLLLFSAAVVAAEAAQTAQGSAPVDYGTGVGRKLGRGVANLLFGWLEFPKGIQDVGDQQNFIAGITWGPIYGAGNALVRTSAGAYELATFLVPLPENFEPIIQPEFVLPGDRY